MLVTHRPAPPLVEVHGPVVRHLRQCASQHTVRSLAPIVGLTFSHLAKIERGDVRRINVSTFDALVRELNVTDPRVLMANPADARTAPAVPVAA